MINPIKQEDLDKFKDLIKDALPKEGDETTSPFRQEYPNIPHPASTNKELHPDYREFFNYYYRVLKGYADNNDSQFISDFMIYGIREFGNVVGDPVRLNWILSRRFYEIKTKTIEDMDIVRWALFDVLLIQTGGFIPSRIKEKELI